MDLNGGWLRLDGAVWLWIELVGGGMGCLVVDRTVLPWLELVGSGLGLVRGGSGWLAMDGVWLAVDGDDWLWIGLVGGGCCLIGHGRG